MYEYYYNNALDDFIEKLESFQRTYMIEGIIALILGIIYIAWFISSLNSIKNDMNAVIRRLDNANEAIRRLEKLSDNKTKAKEYNRKKQAVKAKSPDVPSAPNDQKRYARIHRDFCSVPDESVYDSEFPDIPSATDGAVSDPNLTGQRQSNINETDTNIK